MSPASTAPPLLALEGLTVAFPTPGGLAPAVVDMDLVVHPGEVLALVGESGCGKTATALAVMDLLPPQARVSGAVLWKGQPLMATRQRGRDLSMVFQEPATALNPVLSVQTQVAEPLAVHRGLRGRTARTEVLRLLTLAGLPSAEDLLRAYPHQLSGGQRQRVMLAMALACEPELLLADEPTTALDASVRAGILDTLEELGDRLGLAILLVSHDLGVVERIAHRVAVIYAGRIVELAPREALFSRPTHPYTKALLACRPDPYSDAAPADPIPGQPPDIGQRPPGCAFHPRCPRAQASCSAVVPTLQPQAGAPQHAVACPHTKGSQP